MPLPAMTMNGPSRAVDRLRLVDRVDHDQSGGADAAAVRVGELAQRQVVLVGVVAVQLGHLGRHRAVDVDRQLGDAVRRSPVRE